MPELLPLSSGYYIWHYVPNVALSVVASVAWIGIGAALSWKMWKTRTWFCSCFAIGCFMELVGYAARAAAANKTNELVPYMIQSALILLPPVLFAATIYMCLGRLIRYLSASHLSIIRPSRLTKIFVGGDIVSFLIQGNSTPFAVLGDKNPIFPKLGQALVLLGLAVQLISFCLFTYTAMVFHRRLKAAPTERSWVADQDWVKVMHMLYCTSGLIILRSLFRIVEYAMGNDGYPLTHEWTLYAFDTIPMLAVCGLFFWWYPVCLAGVPKNGDVEHVPLETQVSRQSLVRKH
ncbi:RTA1 like protein-domain-containing protein [Rhexocercosporidium sp. MPI-PUGE-AT-0058]|nr:RTA1 like protein-domain-containing protein [Rhexocercosporidium sp. MPI-PUGE-AT-0058]